MDQDLASSIVIATSVILSDDPLALIKEAYLETKILSKTLRETGASIQLKGSPAYCMQWDSSKKTLQFSTIKKRNIIKIDDAIPDIIFAEPKLVLELKCASEFGGKISIPDKDIEGDINKIILGKADLSLFALPERQLNNFRNEARRIGFDKIFPNPKDIKIGDKEIFHATGEWNGTPFNILARRVNAPKPVCELLNEQATRIVFGLSLNRDAGKLQPEDFGDMEER